MKNKFKVGQKLKRSKQTPLPQEDGMNFHLEIPVGKEVIVDGIDRAMLHLQGFKNWHNASDFVLPQTLPTAHLRPAKNGFRFNLVAANGEKVATSEVYTTKAMAKKTLRKYFPDFEIIEK